MTGAASGFERIVLNVVDSTNREAQRHVDAKRPTPVWIAARRQTAGRGRMGRAWETPDGNLAATLCLPYRDKSAAWVSNLTFLATVAVAELVESLATNCEVAIKWPNDVLLNGRKVSGILIENVFAPGSTSEGTVAIGMGVNLVHFPDPSSVRWLPTSIRRETGRAPDFDMAFESLAETVERWLASASRDPGPLLDAWRGRLAGRGERIEVRLHGGSLEGVFHDVDAAGGLLLQTGRGIETISAADIFLTGGD